MQSNNTKKDHLPDRQCTLFLKSNTPIRTAHAIIIHFSSTQNLINSYWFISNKKRDDLARRRVWIFTVLYKALKQGGELAQSLLLVRVVPYV